MRSLLFVPGDSQRKFDKASNGDADALILDLEDSVAAAEKQTARECVAKMLQTNGRKKSFFVRINALDTGMALDDLKMIMPHQPDGIMLPKCESPDILKECANYLAVFEAIYDLPKTKIIGIVTETAASLFTVGAYKNVDERLWGMMWGAEDLATSLGARDNGAKVGYYEPYHLARNLCLAGAASAGVIAIDTICAVLDDMSVVTAEAQAARRDGFGAKAVIHPKHVAPVNLAFTPDIEEIAWAEKVVEAFDKDPSAGVVRIEGKMVDKPHERSARAVLMAANAYS